MEPTRTYFFVLKKADFFFIGELKKVDESTFLDWKCPC
jgi:hypothetical protein